MRISNNVTSHDTDKLCETVLNLNKNITSVAIINKQGRAEASSQRNSNERLSIHTSELFLMHCILEISIGRDFDEQYGPINYYISKRPNLMLFTFPYYDGAVIVSINKNVYPISIAEEIAILLRTKTISGRIITSIR
jgi:hypothetical protein